jgi:hypothetical protein
MRHHLIQKGDLLQQVQEYDLHYLFEPKDIEFKIFSICIIFVFLRTPSNWTRNSVLSRRIASCSDSLRAVSNESTSSRNKMINKNIWDR